LAVTALGAIATTANPQYTTREIVNQVTDARVKLVITVPELIPKVAEPNLRTILLDGDTSSSVHSGANATFYTDLIAGMHETEYRRPPTKLRGTAALLYSSGTTGASKGVVLTTSSPR
jgi:4-coumarate--CoA ligase